MTDASHCNGSTAQKRKFTIKNFVSKYDQMHCFKLMVIIIIIITIIKIIIIIIITIIINVYYHDKTKTYY